MAVPEIELPLSPELVLVSPELREHALSSEREVRPHLYVAPPPVVVPAVVAAPPPNATPCKERGSAPRLAGKEPAAPWCSPHRPGSWSGSLWGPGRAV